MVQRRANAWGRAVCLAHVSAIGLAALGGALGCGGAAATAPEPELAMGAPPPLPSREALAEIAKQKRPTQIFRGDSVEASGWKLVDLPDAIDSSPITPSTLWERELVEVAAAQSQAVLPSIAMRCVARNTALFTMDHGNFPSRAARRAIASRCGSPLGDYSIFSQGWKKVPKTDTDEAIFSRGKAELRKALERMLAGGSFNAGLGVERKDDRVVIVGVAQERTAALESSPLTADEKHQWKLRGKLLRPARAIMALVNRGAYGVADCEIDKSVALPDFSVTCELDAEDASAWANVVAYAPGRLLGEVAVEMKIHAAGAPNDAYAQPSLPDDVAPAPGGDLSASITGMVNAMRAKAGHGALALEVKQSEVAAEVAPHYFASEEGTADPKLADTVALGMIAGWDVTGDVRRGDFVSLTSYGSQDARLLVAEALRAPITRKALLSPHIERVAVGAATQSDSVGVIFGTYEMVKVVPHAARVASVMKRLTELRAGVGLPPPVALQGLEADAATIAGSISQGASPGLSMQALLQKTTDTFAQSSRGFAVLAGSIDELKLPDEIVKKRDLKVAIAVADYRFPGAAWKMQLVVIAFLVGEQESSASADRYKAARVF